MKILIKSFIACCSLLFAGLCSVQAIFDANGAYTGYSQTNPSSVTNIYNSQGQPNTTINAPRQAPQAPSVKG
jgi:hypothetical protein